MILNDLNKFEIDSLYFNGNIVSIGNKVLAESDVKFNSLDQNKFKRFDDSLSDLDFKKQGKKIRALELVPKGVLTKELFLIWLNHLEM